MIYTKHSFFGTLHDNECELIILTYVVALMRVKSSLSCCPPLHALVIKMASSAFSQMGTICLRRGANTGFRIRDTQHKYRRHSVQVSGFPRTEGRISILWPYHCRGMLKIFS